MKFILLFLFCSLANIYPKTVHDVKTDEIIMDINSTPMASPTSNTLILSAGKDSKDYQLYIIDFDTYEIIQLTNSGSNTNPSFSPDGNRIIYTNSKKNRTSKDSKEIYIMDIITHKKIQITHNSYPEANPIFTNNPDTILYFKSTKFQKKEYYLSDFPDGWYEWDIYEFSTAHKTEKKITNFKFISPEIMYLTADNRILVKAPIKTEGQMSKKYQTIINYTDDTLNIKYNYRKSYHTSLLKNINLLVQTGEFPGSDKFYISDLNNQNTTEIICNTLYYPIYFSLSNSNDTIYFIAQERKKDYKNTVNSHFKLFRLNLSNNEITKIDLTTFKIKSESSAK